MRVLIRRRQVSVAFSYGVGSTSGKGPILISSSSSFLHVLLVYYGIFSLLFVLPWASMSRSCMPDSTYLREQFASCCSGRIFHSSIRKF